MWEESPSPAGLNKAFYVHPSATSGFVAFLGTPREGWLGHLCKQGEEALQEDHQRCISALSTLQLSACLPFPPHLPAQAQRGQQQDHEDEEGVTLVHGGPVLSRPGGREKAIKIVTFNVTFFFLNVTFNLQLLLRISSFSNLQLPETPGERSLCSHTW